MTKGELRTVMLRLLKQQREDDRRRKSEAIQRKVFRLTAFRRARTIGCYLALPYEVQTWQMIEEMLAQGKRVVVPVTVPHTKRLTLSEIQDPASELHNGAFGVFEPKRSVRRPVRAGEVDLLLVPGLAFDRRGHRLGHGYGYFDRLLARLPRKTSTVGLAFRFQLFDRLPTTARDHAVQAVLAA